MKTSIFHISLYFSSIYI